MNLKRLQIKDQQFGSRWGSATWKKKIFGHNIPLEQV
jgi:hypothetical protein